MELNEILVGNNSIQKVWDVLCDCKFYNFSLLLSLIESNAVKVEQDQIKLIHLMSKSGYKEFLKSDIKLPSMQEQDLIQKLLILDFIDLAESCNGQIDFNTLKDITHSKSIESLIEFLILVLTMGLVKGTIDIQKKILVVSDVIPRNYWDLKHLIDKIEGYSCKIQESIQLLSSQIDVIDSRQEKWKKEEEEYQAQLKKVSDKVKLQSRSK